MPAVWAMPWIYRQAALQATASCWPSGLVLNLWKNIKGMFRWMGSRSSDEESAEDFFIKLIYSFSTCRFIKLIIISWFSLQKRALHINMVFKMVACCAADVFSVFVTACMTVNQAFAWLSIWGFAYSAAPIMYCMSEVKTGWDVFCKHHFFMLHN